MKKAVIILSATAIQRAESPIINSAGHRPAKWLKAPTGRYQPETEKQKAGGLSARNAAHDFFNKNE